MRLIPLIVLAFSLFASMAKGESNSREPYLHRLNITTQNYEHINFGYKRDTKQYKYIDFEKVSNHEPTIKDSLMGEYYYCIPEKPIASERRNSSGELEVLFESKNNYDYYRLALHRDTLKEEYYAVEQTVYQIEKETELRFDQLKPYSRLKKEYFSNLYALPHTNHYRALNTDSLFSYTYPPESGANTPEWNTYHILGDNIKDVKAKTKANFSLSLGVYGMEHCSRERWSEQLYSLSTEWYDSMIGDNSFRIPIIKGVVIDSVTLSKINKQFEVAKREVMSQREKWINSEYEMTRTFFTALYKELDVDLSPEKIDTTTLSGQRLYLDLKSFTTHIDIEYKDGSERRYILQSIWEYSVP